MVVLDTWNRLGSAGQKEFESLFRQFQDSLRDNVVHDGFDLAKDWSVIESDDRFVIFNSDTELTGVSSSRRDVIVALCKDGCVNLNH